MPLFGITVKKHLCLQMVPILEINYHTPGDSIGTLNFTFMTNAESDLSHRGLAVPLSAGFDDRDLYPTSIEEHHHDFPANRG